MTAVTVAGCRIRLEVSGDKLGSPSPVDTTMWLWKGRLTPRFAIEGVNKQESENRMMFCPKPEMDWSVVLFLAPRALQALVVSPAVWLLHIHYVGPFYFGT